MLVALLRCNKGWKSVHWVSHRLMAMTWWWNTNTLSQSVFTFVGKHQISFLCPHLKIQIVHFTTLADFQPIIFSTRSNFTVRRFQLVMLHYGLYAWLGSCFFRSRMAVIDTRSDSGAPGTKSVTDWPHTVCWFCTGAALWRKSTWGWMLGAVQTLA